MKIIKSVKKMQDFSKAAKKNGKRIGFVPTMGYLHEGHLSLIRQAEKECDTVVVSVFVNPAQFGPKEDFEEYPRDFERDRNLVEGLADILFNPGKDQIYNDNLTWVDVESLSGPLCGKSRPGHFRGVATVVSKLFNIITPDAAYFGQKDYQQCLVIKKMARDLNYDTKIRICPTVREKDGLAMSSRNKYLNVKERKASTVLYKALLLAKELSKTTKDPNKIKKLLTGKIKEGGLAKIDYIEILDAKDLSRIKKIEKEVIVALAVFIGKTRLIDNILIK